MSFSQCEPEYTGKYCTDSRRTCLNSLPLSDEAHIRRTLLHSSEQYIQVYSGSIDYILATGTVSAKDVPHSSMLFSQIRGVDDVGADSFIQARLRVTRIKALTLFSLITIRVETFVLIICCVSRI